MPQVTQIVEQGSFERKQELYEPAIHDMARRFRYLTWARAYECFAYYEDHREEIDWWIDEQMAKAPE